TRWPRDWSSDVCSSDLQIEVRSPRLEDGLEIAHGVGERLENLVRLGDEFAQAALPLRTAGPLVRHGRRSGGSAPDVGRDASSGSAASAPRTTTVISTAARGPRSGRGRSTG